MQKNVPSAADNNISISPDVLLYKERPRNEWVGPYKVIAGDKENLLLNIDGRITPASVDKVELYHLDNSTNPSQEGKRQMDSIPDRIISGETFFVRLCAVIGKVTGRNSNINDDDT